MVFPVLVCAQVVSIWFVFVMVVGGVSLMYVTRGLVWVVLSISIHPSGSSLFGSVLFMSSSA